MSKRTDALWRIVALLWQAIVGYVLTLAVGTVGTAWMVIDVLWQLIVGSDGLDKNGMVGSYIKRTFQWAIGQTLFAVLGAGDGKFRALP